MKSIKKSIKKCTKEWNAVIEALGHGKQIILIRKYPPTANEFLLYPTFSYARINHHLDFFKKNYRDFVSEHANPKQTDKTIEIKYFAKVEGTKKMAYKDMWRIKDEHMWEEDHVKGYLKGKKAVIWFLRVYKLKNPVMVKKAKGMLYANLDTAVELEGSPVLSEPDFKEKLF